MLCCLNIYIYETIFKNIEVQYCAKLTCLYHSKFAFAFTIENLVEIKHNIGIWCFWESIYIQNLILKQFSSMTFFRTDEYFVIYSQEKISNAT